MKTAMKLKNTLKKILLVVTLLLISLRIHTSSSSEVDSSTPKAALKELIAEAETRTLAEYTPLSWSRMMSMLVVSKSIYNNQAATESEINNAIDLLRTRLNELAQK